MAPAAAAKAAVVARPLALVPGLGPVALPAAAAQAAQVAGIWAPPTAAAEAAGILAG